jgi:hypothetical protein
MRHRRELAHDARHFTILCGAFAENGLVTNLAALLTEHGVAPYFAALALSVRGAAGILGRLGTGLLIMGRLFDRTGAYLPQYILGMAAALSLALRRDRQTAVSLAEALPSSTLPDLES